MTNYSESELIPFALAAINETPKGIETQLLIKKNLPHNFLAEQILLNCLITNSETIKLTFKLLPIEAFYFKNHQEIYKALIFMSKNQL